MIINAKFTVIKKQKAKNKQTLISVLLSSSNTSETLPLSTTKNITCVGLSPDGNLAIVVDEGEKFH